VIAVSKSARSSRSNSAAVRTRIPAAFSSQRAASGKNGSWRWNWGNSFPPCRKRNNGEHPLASLRSTQHMDLRAALVFDAQGLEAQDRLDCAPIVRQLDLRGGIGGKGKGIGGFVERLIEELQTRPCDCATRSPFDACRPATGRGGTDFATSAGAPPIREP